MFVLKGVASHILQNAILVLLVDNAHAHCIALCLFDIFVITDRQRFIKKAKVENSVVKKLSLLILIISSEIHYSMFHCMSTAA